MTKDEIDFGPEDLPFRFHVVAPYVRPVGAVQGVGLAMHKTLPRACADIVWRGWEKEYPVIIIEDMETGKSWSWEFLKKRRATG